MKGIDESNDWQDLSIFNSIRTFLKLIDEDIIKRGIDYKFSSRAILPESNVMISGSEKSLVLDKNDLRRKRGVILHRQKD